MTGPTTRKAPSGGLSAQANSERGLPRPTMGVDSSDVWLGLLAESLGVDQALLVEFNEAMTSHGLGVAMPRFFLDLGYAYRELASAHSLGDPRLCLLAMRIFEACRRVEDRRRQGVLNLRIH